MTEHGASGSGYSPVTKWLHWVVFSLMAAQFVVGYALEELDEDEFSEDRLFALHASLGLLILVVATIRVWWRQARPLPPWAPTLSAFERRYTHWVERVLYLLMFTIPLSGLALALSDERRFPWGQVDVSDRLEDFEDLFETIHIGSHIVFFIAFALHVGLVIKHQLVNRDQLLNRML